MERDVKQSVAIPAAIVAIVVLVGLVWFVAARTVFKGPPEPPKLKPAVKVRPNMTAEEAGRIFAIPQGSR